MLAINRPNELIEFAMWRPRKSTLTHFHSVNLDRKGKMKKFLWTFSVLILFIDLSQASILTEMEKPGKKLRILMNTAD